MKRKNRCGVILRSILDPLMGVLVASVIFCLAIMLLSGFAFLIAKAVECIT